MEPIRQTPPAPAGTAGAHSAPQSRVDAAERLAEGRPPQLAAPAAAAPAAAPLRRGLPGFDNRLQGDVASAQQALEFLDEVAGQLQALKGDLSAKLANLQADERQIEAKLRQLASTLDQRRQAGGARLDARLAFSPEAAASQRFRVRSMQLETLQSAPAQLLSFSMGGIGAPLTVSLEPGLSGDEIVQRFDRALAPAGVRASLGKDGELIFSTPESSWPAVRDNLSVSGRGRVGVEEELPSVAPQRWGTGGTEALRLSLQEVVRALAQVRRSQEAASRELSAAASRAAAAPVLDADVNAMAQDFAATATAPTYDSLLTISSAMVGVSRERVVALLGLR